MTISRRSTIPKEDQNCTNCKHAEIRETPSILHSHGKSPVTIHLVCNYPHDPVETPDFSLDTWCSHWEEKV